MRPFNIIMYNAFYYFKTKKYLLLKMRKLEYIEEKEKELNDEKNALTDESNNLEKDEVRILENELNNMKYQMNSLYDDHYHKYKLYLQYIDALS